ncbi:LysR family transcriptional regulator [Caballeronia sp. J97]|uniref:LysR family transcriptional regulator n=1 Tax=Caballeronia sp. J97 TaxID=2805429 RepID=UPI002AAF2FF3|nr:LysR family transcriptional regulator [Caballeronia sp. J97]
MDRFAGMSVFVKTVEHGSFTAAADALNMSPQLVAKQIQKLEEHLGVRLLHRTTRRQSVTDFGRSFYDRAKSILLEVEMAENLAAETRGVPTGRLRINAQVTYGLHILAPRLPEYFKAYPKVAVEFTLTNRDVYLIEEGYDAIFRTGEPSDSGLIARPLAPYPMVLCAAPSYLAGRPAIRTPWDVQQHECLGSAFTEMRRKWTFDGPDGRVVVPISSRLVFDNGETQLCAALAGTGLMLQPLALAQAALDDGRLVVVLPDYPPPSRAVHVYYAADRRVTPKLNSFLDFVVKALGPSAKID